MRIAVTADIHADDFGSRIDPATGLAVRWTDSLEMLGWVATDARQRGAEVLVIAGDFTESRNPSPPRVAQIGEQIARFGGPTVLLRGNHDGIRADRSIVDALAQGRPEWFGFTRPGIATIGASTIVALPFLDRHVLRTLPGFETIPDSAIFATLREAFLSIAAGKYVQARETTTGPIVLVCHQGLAGGLMSDSQQAFLGDLSLVVDTRALTAIGYDAILAGHFHKHQVLSTSPLVAYAGAPSRTDFGEAAQVKGYLIVDVERGSASIEFIDTPARRFVTLRAGCGYNVDEISGAIVRAVDVDPGLHTDNLRRMLEADGVFEVTEIRRAPVVTTAAAGGMSESLAPAAALTEYFAGDPDRDALVERGRELLAAAA